MKLVLHCLVGVCIFAWAVSGAPVASADTFTVHDLTDFLTISTDGDPSRFLSGGSNGVPCIVAGFPINGSETFCFFIGPPPGAGILSANSLEQPVGIGEGNGDLSDAIQVGGASILQITFGSDPIQTFESVSTAGSCTSPNLPQGCTITEDGSQQVAGILIWDNGAEDTIKFESDRDVPPVPEPPTALLAGSGGMVTFALAYLKRRAQSKAAQVRS